MYLHGVCRSFKGWRRYLCFYDWFVDPMIAVARLVRSESRVQRGRVVESRLKTARELSGAVSRSAGITGGTTKGWRADTAVVDRRGWVVGWKHWRIRGLERMGRSATVGRAKLGTASIVASVWRVEAGAGRGDKAIRVVDTIIKSIGRVEKSAFLVAASLSLSRINQVKRCLWREMLWIPYSDGK